MQEYIYLSRDELTKMQKAEKAEIEQILRSKFPESTFEKILHGKRVVRTNKGDFKFTYESRVSNRSKTISIDHNSIEIRKEEQIDKLLERKVVTPLQHNIARLYNVGYSLSMRGLIRCSLNFERLSSGGSNNEYLPNEGCEFLKEFYHKGNLELKYLGYSTAKIVDMVIINDITLKQVSKDLKMSYSQIESAICEALDFLRDIKKKC